MESIKETDFKKLAAWEKEMILVHKIRTVDTYLKLADTLDIAENPKQIMTKQNYKAIITSKSMKDDVGYIPGYGMYMCSDEFDNFVNAYKELKEL